MAAERMTSADVLALNSSEEIVGVIEETRKQFPEIDTFFATPVTKTSYKTLIQTALPDVTFREINVGREVKKPTLVARDVDCKFLDASWNIDEAATDACEWGADAAKALQAKAHLMSALATICSQIWYGITADANGFAGVASLLDNSDDSMVIDAGGTGDECSSVFLVRFGIQDVALAWGMSGQIKGGDVLYLPIPDASGNPFWGYSQAVSGYVGLQITNYTSMARIANLTTEAGEGLTDDLISDALALFKVGEKPDAMYYTRRSEKQLQQSRTATNQTGAPAPFPTEAFQVPLYASESVLDTETALTPGT